MCDFYSFNVHIKILFGVVQSEYEASLGTEFSLLWIVALKMLNRFSLLDSNIGGLSKRIICLEPRTFAFYGTLLQKVNKFSDDIFFWGGGFVLLKQRFKPKFWITNTKKSSKFFLPRALQNLALELILWYHYSEDQGFSNFLRYLPPFILFSMSRPPHHNKTELC